MQFIKDVLDVLHVQGRRHWAKKNFLRKIGVDEREGVDEKCNKN